MEGLLRAAAVERGGGGGLVGLLGGRDSEFRPVASACIPGWQNCVLASSQRSASRTPVSRIAHWTRSSTARVFAWPSPFRASPTFSRSAELVGGCRQVGVRVRGLYPLKLLTRSPAVGCARQTRIVAAIISSSSSSSSSRLLGLIAAPPPKRGGPFSGEPVSCNE